MGAKMYRGIKLNDLPPELWEHIRRHLRMPYEESEVGQHFKIGPVLLDHIENSHWEQGREDFAGTETANLGRNWTLNRSWAEKASSPNTGRCEFPVLLEADMPTNPDAYDPNNNNEDQRVMNSEQQVTPIPGAPLNVTGVKIRDGQEWREVLNDPEYVARRSKEYPSVAEHHTGPQVRIALNTPTFDEDYAEERWREGSKYFFSFSPPTYIYRGPKVRPAPPRPEGFVDESDYNFTGTMDTQYHHRSITPEVDKDIDRRKDSIDDYYEEMRQRKDSGLEPIPWKEWLNRTAFIRTSMPITHLPPMNHFDENLFRRQMKQLVYNDDEIDNGKPEYAGIIRSQYMNAGAGPVDEYGALVTYIHHDEQGRPNGILHYFPHGSYRAGEKPGGIQVMVHPARQGKGIGTKLLQQALSEFGVDAPGEMGYEPIDLENQQYTPGGYGLYQRMHKEAMAWDEWAPQIQHLKPDGGIGIYYVNHGGDKKEDSQLAYSLSRQSKQVSIHGLYTNENHRSDGVAEAMVRRLREDYPDYAINPGSMTEDGQAFHDRMLEKEPEARQLVTAMAWQDWAPKIKGGCVDGCPKVEIHGRYVIPEAGAFLNYTHRGDGIFISDLYTHPSNRRDGVAEALMRRLTEDHPGVLINPGYMTPDGQNFHDRMLDKEPEAKSLITAREWGHL